MEVQGAIQTAALATACVAREEGRDGEEACEAAMIRLTRLAQRSREAALAEARRLVAVAYEKCAR